MFDARRLLKRIEPKFKALIRNKHFRYGGPFFTFMFVGVFMLYQSQAVRYEFRKNKTLTREELRALGFNVPDKEPTLEEEYEKVKHLGDQEWKNIRIPRLWENQEAEN